MSDETDREVYAGPKAGFEYREGRYEPIGLSVQSSAPLFGRSKPVEIRASDSSSKHAVRDALMAVLLLVAIAAVILGLILWSNHVANDYQNCMGKPDATEEACGKPGV